MFPEPFARRGILFRTALPRDIAALRGSLVENVVGRLNGAGRVELAQEIAGADQAHPLINDGAPLLDIGVLEQQQCLGGGVAAQQSAEGFDRRLLAEPANRTALLEPPLLVDVDIGRGDLHRAEMVVDPGDDLLRARRAMDLRGVDIDRVRDPHRQPRPQQDVERSRPDQREQRRRIGHD